MSIENILKKVKDYYPSADLKLLKKAYLFAESAHKGMKRVSGDPFITHPVCVAEILVDLHLDIHSIVCGFLHDTLEDTNIINKDIEDAFGTEIAELVEGVSNIRKIANKSREERKIENLRKMLLATAKDIRVVLVKLADRLHNVRTLEYLNKERQKKVAHETLDIYAPLAHRLGIGRIKWELEDLSFRYMEPELYYKICEQLNQTLEERETYILNAKKILEKELRKINIKAEITGRPKYIYSIYQKLKAQKIGIDKMYDLQAFRIITNTIRDCYAVLGAIHTLWKPIPHRFKDFVAVPKSNMYQSIHTSVVGYQGRLMEIQIRTHEMHKIAEEGIAAHWIYKEKSKVIDEEFNRKISWLRNLIEIQDTLKDPKEFMESLKIELFSDEVFVFTPKGEVKSLPKDSTPIDFAYLIHTDIGHSCIGAKVNDRIVPLKYKLKSGDIVSIMTSSKQKPSRDWIKIAKTTKVKSRIGHWFKERELAFEEKQKEKERDISVRKDVIKEKTTGSESIKREKFSIIIPGMEGEVETYFAKCCNPIPGDKIVGYITQGRGISIHRTSCNNITPDKFPEEHFIKVRWFKGRDNTFEVSISIVAFNREGLLADILNVVHGTSTIVNEAYAKFVGKGQATGKLVVLIKDVSHLKEIVKKIESVNSVIKVYRG
ncbi:MAG: bifunctional (p)ppGpp synthetase/guanosine-3',5'-bis(diphosphate) 3'-pyrophosphohydrolase [bacterium]|nr:bifunctional (p)ppGpp synthetase/guanosine-3',5'-bis(diphosphate) 3'-pyrophosphohydrolase [bacterium]